MSQKRKQLSVEERATIIHSYEILGSIRKVSASLSHPYSTVRYTINRFKETKTNEDRPGRGRFETLSSSEKRYIKLISKRDRTKTVPMDGARFTKMVVALLNYGGNHYLTVVRALTQQLMILRMMRKLGL